jgi:hypothetical protein
VDLDPVELAKVGVVSTIQVRPSAVGGVGIEVPDPHRLARAPVRGPAEANPERPRVVPEQHDRAASEDHALAGRNPFAQHLLGGASE